MKDRRPAFTPHAKPRTDDANAFLPDPEDGPAHTSDDLAESLAENFLQAATTGENQDDRTLDASVSEEIGGPFVETDIDDEVAFDEDGSNPPDAEPAGLPQAVSGLAAESTLEEDLDEDDDDDETPEPRTVEPADIVKDATSREPS